MVPDLSRKRKLAPVTANRWTSGINSVVGLRGLEATVRLPASGGCSGLTGATVASASAGGEADCGGGGGLWEGAASTLDGSSLRSPGNLHLPSAFCGHT